MMTTFKTDEDKIRELKSVTTFVNIFGGSFKRLDANDVNFKIFDKDKNLIAYVEVIPRLRSMRMAYPLIVPVKKMIKLIDKRLNPTLIWCCEDGIIYGRVEHLNGTISFDGRTPSAGTPNNSELMAYFDKQKSLKYVRFT